MESNLTVIISVLLLYVEAYGDDVSDSTDRNKTVSCPGPHDVEDIDIMNVTGKWKVVELYMHLSNEGVHEYNSCPEITIWETDEIPRTTFGPSTENQFFHVEHINARFRKEYRHIRLLWDEAGQNIEYSLYFRNDSAGYWQAFDGQNGTLASRHNYNQFSGTVQVLKAVNDHLVLNFCQEERNGRPAQQYTVLFSREPGSLSRWEIDAVHKMLQTKQLSIASRRLVCGNSAENLIRNTYLTVISLVLACVFSS